MQNRTFKLAVLVALLLTGTVLAQASLPTGAVQPAPAQFEDLSPDHWAADAITRLTALGVITGYPNGTFGGARAATRYELAVVSARLIDLISSSITELISDPEFRRAIEESAATHERLLRLEEMLDAAADSDYVWQLAERLANVEEYLNSQAGSQLFPGLAAIGEDGLSVGERDPLTDEEMAAIMSQLEQRIAGARSLALSQYWVGVQVGWPVIGAISAGARDVIVDDVSVRFSAGFALPASFAVGLNVFYEFDSVFGDPATTVYVGPGLLGRFGGGSGGLDLELLVGVEYSLPAGPVSVFAELGPGFTLSPNAGDALFIGRVGMNYGF